MNFVTAPLVADLFLLAILAIGKKEVHDGTIGANGIEPYDIMLFFLSLAYIAISVDASGLIRWLAFKVLQKGGKVGHRLFFYLYAFFFSLTALIGNDPIILSGTAFLSYMTRVSSNIKHPRAWIYTQFAVANIASAILVSSNPTNLVLAGAFGIKFINYTANVIVPVLVTGVVLFPFLLYIIFHDESLIPASIKMEDLPEELKNKKPVNPNIPFAKGEHDERVTENDPNSGEEEGNQLSLEEILNPFLDKKGAIMGAGIMATTLITVLVLNAVGSGKGDKYPVFWVTLPAAVVMFSIDLTFGWLNREETRRIAHEGRQRAENAQAERAEVRRQSIAQANVGNIELSESNTPGTPDEKVIVPETGKEKTQREDGKANHPAKRTTLSSFLSDRSRWAQETFPTTMTVFHHLPFALIPFAFCMFVLVQALVTKGWVPVFAHGWDHWVEKTGTVGAVGGMGFVSVILCNVSPLTLHFSSSNLTQGPVRWHKHRHHDPHLARHPSLARNPQAKRRPHLGPDLLGHGLQHGDWRQFRRIQLGVQRIARGYALARHSGSETYPCWRVGVCARQSAYYCNYDGSWAYGTDWADLCHEGRLAVLY
jgi:Na+/H+ antiporter NhaD/arsenite permease-like protein